MTISDVGIVFSICSSLLIGTGTGANYYLEHEYVPVSGLLKKEIRDARKDIRELEYLKKNEGLNDYQQFQLEQLYNDKKELIEELNE